MLGSTVNSKSLYSASVSWPVLPALAFISIPHYDVWWQVEICELPDQGCITAAHNQELNVQSVDYKCGVLPPWHQCKAVHKHWRNTNPINVMCSELVQRPMVLTRHVQQISIAADIMHLTCVESASHQVTSATALRPVNKCHKCTSSPSVKFTTSHDQQLIVLSNSLQRSKRKTTNARETGIPNRTK